MTNNEGNDKRPLDFIRQIIDEDLRQGRHNKSYTRFPPEPNGYLHIGHAKSICLNFGVAEEFAGSCNLRFDDTNPTKEESAYVEAIKRDVAWLGFSWSGEVRYASDYFQQLYDFAVALIRKGKAYVCELNAEEMRDYRGTFTEPGKNSPWRERSIDENLLLFAKMKAGEFAEGSHVLRAKIDMASPNLNMRDPVLYRIIKTSHHRTGDAWQIYPMYDYTHCLSDMLEGITHSLCTLEFEDHRPLYDWVLDTLETPCHPRQIEFARLNLSHFITSKRKLLRLVEEGYVDGWDDPRMLTISGLRRRGYTPASIRSFCTTIGVSKSDSRIDLSVLEDELRNDLNINAERRLCVLDPLKLVIDNFPENHIEMVDAKNHPQDPAKGVRPVPFTREIYIEREDFMEEPPRKYFRLGPGREVRLKYGYLVRYVSHTTDDAGNVTAVHCIYDPESRGGFAPDGRKVKGTIHWVSATEGVAVKVNMYDRLFTVADPGADAEVDFVTRINPDSISVIPGAIAEPGLREMVPGNTVQFERLGYFCADSKESTPGAPVFNRTVTLRDSWGDGGRAGS